MENNWKRKVMQKLSQSRIRTRMLLRMVQAFYYWVLCHVRHIMNRLCTWPAVC